MEFRILGPLEVVVDGRSLDLGAAKQRALLACLLLHANEVVSTDHLIDALWEDSPPKRAHKALQVYVSQLRKTLGRDRIGTRNPGYVLRLDEGELDLQRFQQLACEGRFEEGLRLWRGAPLPEFACQQFAQAEIARLGEVRLTCLERRIDDDLAAGGHAEVVGEIEALVAEHPLRESLRSQLMLALYRSGRQAEALEAYQDARRALTEQLGIEPGRELRELERAILLQETSLDWAATDARAPVSAPARGAFVGREAELEKLLAALDDALAGHGRVVLIGGEPGIGKSRLIDELIGHTRARGARILVGRCWEAGGAPAYWPWVQALRTYVRDSGADEVRAQLGEGASEMAQILPDVRALLPGLPEPPTAESESARFRLFDATASFLKRAAVTRPLVFVLDNLHAADTPSLLMLEYLSGDLTESRILILAAFRDIDPTLQAPLSATLASLARQPVTRRLALSGLMDTEVASFIELAEGVTPREELVEAIHGDTDGNPLFVGEVVRLLAQEGLLEGGREEVERAGVPQGVREVIGRRVAHLSDMCRQTLVLAAVLGSEFGLVALEHVSGLTLEELLDALDEAMRAKVVGEVPGWPGRLRFAHAVIRDTIYEELTPVRRIGLHRLAGEALELLYAQDLGPHLAELAHHFVAAAPGGSSDQAIEYARRAGDSAASQLAYEEAVRLYEMALKLVDDGVARCELLLASGDAQARSGDTPASKATYRATAELARKLELPEQLARAALGYGGRIVWDVSRDDEYLVPLLESALAALGNEDSSLRVRLLARLAGGPLRDARFPLDRKALLSREALEMARRIGDSATLAYALSGYIPANESPENTQELLERATELLRVAMEVGDKERAVEAYEARVGRLIELGQMAEARSALESMARLAEELRQPAQQWLAGVCQARQALLEGRLAEAEESIGETLKLGERAHHWNATVTFRLQLYVLRREQGRLQEVTELVRRSVEEYPTYPIWRCVAAQMAAELGLETESKQTFEALAKDQFVGLRFEELWLLSLGLLAETARSLDDPSHAPVLYELLMPYADRVAVIYPEISIGSVARYLGLMAATMGRWEDAQQHFEDAIAINERIGARPWLAHTQEDYARMLLAVAGPGDAGRAAELLDQALATYRELGMESYAAKGSALAVRLATV